MRKGSKRAKTNGDMLTGNGRKRGRPAGSKNKIKPSIGTAHELRPLTVELKLDATPFNRELDEIEARIKRLGNRLSGTPAGKRRGRPPMEKTLGG